MNLMTFAGVSTEQSWFCRVLCFLDPGQLSRLARLPLQRHPTLHYQAKCQSEDVLFSSDLKKGTCVLRRRMWNEDHGWSLSNSPAAAAISFSLARHVACTWAENAQVLQWSRGTICKTSALHLPFNKWNETKGSDMKWTTMTWQWHKMPWNETKWDERKDQSVKKSIFRHGGGEHRDQLGLEHLSHADLVDLFLPRRRSIGREDLAFRLHKWRSGLCCEVGSMGNSWIAWAGAERKNWCFNGSCMTRLSYEFVFDSLKTQWPSVFCLHELARKVGFLDRRDTETERETCIAFDLFDFRLYKTPLIAQRCREALKEESGDMEKDSSSCWTDTSRQLWSCHEYVCKHTSKTY